MSSAPWRRCSTTGYRIGMLAGLPEQLLRPDGSLDPGAWSDCNLFNVSSIAAVAGATNVTRFERKALRDPRFAHHEIRDDEGLVTVATHADSAVAYGAIIKAEAATRSRANLRRGPVSFALRISESDAG
jgi:hypothetical protein